MEAEIAAAAPEGEWTLTLADDDPDQQSIRFSFPASLTAGLNAYSAPSVKLEFGARSDHFPVESHSIRPYLDDALPQVISQPAVVVRVLHVERTFWEKATILHAMAHQPLEKRLGKAQSRHYYDLFQLANHAVSSGAILKLDLPARVAEHKSIYFKDAKARYDLARPETLRLIPDSTARLEELRRDYRDMQPMFFGPAPTYSQIVTRLGELQSRINSRGNPGYSTAGAAEPREGAG